MSDQLTPSPGALAAVLARHVLMSTAACSCGSYPYTNVSHFAEHQAQELLATRTIRAADELAQDEALVGQVAERTWGHAQPLGSRHLVRRNLAGLAAVLSEGK